MSEELNLPMCPFCDENPEWVFKDAGCKISCLNKLCGIQPSTEWFGYKEAAIKNWSTRPLSEHLELLKELKNEIESHLEMFTAISREDFGRFVIDKLTAAIEKLEGK